MQCKIEKNQLQSEMKIERTRKVPQLGGIFVERYFNSMLNREKSILTLKIDRSIKVPQRVGLWNVILIQCKIEKNQFQH